MLTERSGYTYMYSVMGHFSVTRDFDIQFKVTIVGNSGVGKTSVLQTLTGKKLENQYLPTIGEHTLVSAN